MPNLKAEDVSLIPMSSLQWKKAELTDVNSSHLSCFPIFSLHISVFSCLTFVFISLFCHFVLHHISLLLVICSDLLPYSLSCLWLVNNHLYLGRWGDSVAHQRSILLNRLPVNNLAYHCLSHVMDYGEYNKCLINVLWSRNCVLRLLY